MTTKNNDTLMRRFFCAFFWVMLKEGGDDMPWNEKDYPESFKNFDPPLRKKAIEIANALLEEGYEEGRAIPIATSQAEKWYESHKGEQ